MPAGSVTYSRCWILPASGGAATARVMAKVRNGTARKTRSFIRRNYITAALISSLFLPASAVEMVSYRKQIEPILAFHCVGCHGDDGVASGLDMRSFSRLRKGGERGNVVVPGDPESSGMV